MHNLFHDIFIFCGLSLADLRVYFKKAYNTRRWAISKISRIENLRVFFGFLKMYRSLFGAVTVIILNSLFSP